MIARDRTLMERWRATHDAEAFAEIVSRHSAMVYGTCKRVLGNPTDAEDVAQECFLELAESRTAIRSSLGGWLHKAAVHRSLNRIKADSRRKQREARFAAEVGYSSGPSWDDIQAHIDEAIAALPDKLREPVIHRFLEGQTHEAIAQNLGISRSTVQYRLARGVEEIRKSLKRRGIPVATAVLTAMLGTNLAKAGAVPASLTAALGKVAIVGSSGSAAAASGVALGSKVALVGGTAIMWKNVSIALGVVVVALGLSYGLHFRAERRGLRRLVPTQTEESMVSRTAEERAREAARQPGSPHGAEPGVLHRGTGEGFKEGEEAGLDALVALEKLLKAAYEKGGAEQERPEGLTLEPFSSENIPAENGAHYFMLAAELFPEVNRDWLFAKWDEIRARGWSDDPGLRALFAACRNSIDAVRTGIAAGNAVMPEPRGPLEQMPYLRTFRDLARVMAMEAQMLAAEGNYAAAFEAYHAAQLRK
jgi:RNA polymerase sigma factor (sigma-70 family)